ncbi:cyclic nucleotide-binding domain-containing protein [Actinoplanes sp. NPDC049596]|uniref:Crp/Fnr family transcriptional regulator n=1 Tax=unclassified Actinoplanes TaxID=2626549 RepID=UPI00341D9BAC
MSPLSVFDLLAMHDFVADLPSGWLHRLAAAGRPVFLGAGRRLCREDAHADRFWLINSGAVVIDFHVPGRGDIVVERVGPGAPVGWSWMRPPARWRFGAVVAEDVHAVELDAKRVLTMIAEDAELGRELTGRMLAVVSARLQAARHRLIELYAYPTESPC